MALSIHQGHVKLVSLLNPTFPRLDLMLILLPETDNSPS